MLAAARRLFARDGFAQTSIRAIAAASDVNQGLIVTYFGSKEALFMEAVGRFQVPRDALDGGIDGMGSRLARAYVDRWETMAEDDPWPALVRSAFSHEASAKLLRTELEKQLTTPLREVLGATGDSPARIAMVQCLMAGMILARYISGGLEPVRSLPADVFEAAFAACLQQALDGPLVTPRKDRG